MAVETPTIKQALLEEELPSKRVQCNLCERRCKLSQGAKSRPTRSAFARHGRTSEVNFIHIVYGDISSMSANSIEKKPFYHFWSGSLLKTSIKTALLSVAPYR
jgi:pyruvate formate lyase activating enzyme